MGDVAAGQATPSLVSDPRWTLSKHSVYLGNLGPTPLSVPLLLVLSGGAGSLAPWQPLPSVVTQPAVPPSFCQNHTDNYIEQPLAVMCLLAPCPMM